MQTTARIFIDSYLDYISNKYIQTNDKKKNRDFAFEIFSISVLLDKSFDEVVSSIQTKNNTFGFDGFFMEEQPDGSYVHYVFQCKNKEFLKQNELDKFVHDYYEIFNKGNVNKLDLNIDLKNAYDEYVDLTKKRCIINPKLVFIFFGDKNDKESKNSLLYQKYHNPNEFEIYDANDLYKEITSDSYAHRNEVAFKFQAEKSNISPRDSQSLYSYSILNIKSANFRISVKQICDLIDNEIKINGSEAFLFEKNIRTFLRMSAKPNKKMVETLMSDDFAVYFPFFNNGITIIADQLDIPSMPQNGQYLISVKNPQIVNGLQTSKVIQEINRKNPERLEGVSVNVRIYETSNPELIDRITDATNTQSPINFRDKISNSSIIKNLKILFASKGVDFIAKRGEQFNPVNQEKYSESISSDTLLKFWYATFYGYPEIAKNSISTVLQEIYDSIDSATGRLSYYFNNPDNADVYSQMVDTYYIYKIVQKKKKENNIDEFLSSADELICYGIQKKISNEELEFSDENLEKAYSYAFLTTKKAVEKTMNEYNSKKAAFSYNNFFKNPKCRIVYDELAGL